MKNDVNYPMRFTVVLASLALFINAVWNSFLNLGYEGGWILYSKALNSGADLHKDLGYLLPGFYPKFHTAIFNLFGQNELFLDLFGIFLFLVFFLLVRALYRKQSKIFDGWEIWGLTIFTCSLVFLFKPFRVNDYHLISLLGIVSASLMILSKRAWINCLALLPVIMVMSNRIHDGLALALACCLVILIRKKGFFNLLLFILGLVLGTYLLINTIDPQYLGSDILSESAKTKGLSLYGVVLIFVKVVVQNIAYFVVTTHGAITVGLIVFWKIVVDLLEERGKDIRLIYLLFSFIFAVMLFDKPSILIMVISFIGGGIFLSGLKNYRTDFGSNYFALIIIFFSYFFSSSLSSFGDTSEHAMQCSLLSIALVFFLVEKGVWENHGEKLKISIVVLSLGIFFNILYKPFGWHMYASPNLGSGAEISRGRFVKTSVAVLAEKICPVIEGKEVFSLPFSFYTYHCNARPWQNAIATFYDTSNRLWISKLVQRLEVNAPEYLVYTRQLGNLQNHSKLFAGGRPLEQEKFDQIIFDRVLDGKWKVLLIADLDGVILYEPKRNHSLPKLIDRYDDNFKDNLIYLISTNINE